MKERFEEDEDIKSGIGWLLINWRTIILVTLICAVAGAAIGKIRIDKSEVVTVEYEEELKSARDELTEDEALYVEQICKQYKYYDSTLKYWNAYMENSVLQNLDPNTYARKDVQYLLTSDNNNVGKAFLEAVFEQEDYRKIGELLGVDPDAAEMREIINLTVQPENNEAESGGTGPYYSFLIVRVYAQDENKAKGIQAIVDDVVKRKSEEIRKAGTSLTVNKVSEKLVVGDYIQLLNKQKDAMTPMLTVQANRSDFISRTVNILSENQKKYFELLISEGNSVVEEETVSKKGIVKYVIAAGIAGFILAVIAAYLLFAFSGKIHSEGELCGCYNLPILQRFKVGNKKITDPIMIKGLAMLSSERMAGSIEKGAEMLAFDVKKMMESTSGNRIYIAYDCNKGNARSAVEKMVASLTKSGLTVSAGNPHTDEAAYREMTKADAVIMAETLNRSEKGKVRSLTQECSWKNIPVLGYITLIDM